MFWSISILFLGLVLVIGALAAGALLAVPL